MRCPIFAVPAACLVWILSTAGVIAQAINASSRLDFFLTDAALWKLPDGEVQQRLQPFGYTVDARTGVVSLGEPKDMMLRKAYLFIESLPVWRVQLTRGETLRCAVLEFLPPPTIAKVPDKSGVRT